MEKETSLEDVIETVGTFDRSAEFHGVGPYWSFKAQQRVSELKGMAQIAKEMEPDCVVEVGSARGGTFYVWCRYLPADRFISVDLTHRGRGSIFREFSDNRVELIQGNSYSHSTLKEVNEACEGHTPDFVYIDGSHEYDDVKRDFEAYSRLMDGEGIVGFHDIGDDWSGVSRLWQEIQDEYETNTATDEATTGVVYL